MLQDNGTGWHARSVMAMDLYTIFAPQFDTRWFIPHHDVEDLGYCLRESMSLDCPVLWVKDAALKAV
jgi:hypothetical protein